MLVAHVVEQYDIGRRCECIDKLFERIDFNFYNRIAGGVGLLGEKFRVCKIAWLGESNSQYPHVACQVVILNRHGIVQPAAMIVPSSAMHGVLFQPPPTGSRLAGVVQTRGQAMQDGNVLGRPRRDATSASQEIQDRSLAGEHIAHRQRVLLESAAVRAVGV